MGKTENGHHRQPIQWTCQTSLYLQYLLLYQLNNIHEAVRCKNRDFQNFDFYPDIDLYLDLTCYLDVYSDLDRDLSIDLYLDLLQVLDRDLYPDLRSDLDLYLNRVRHFSFYLLLYHDFYRYMDADFHSSNFSKFGERFDRELSERIKVVKRIKDTKIFKGVDLQRMVQRFSIQRKFIKTAGEGKSVKPPAESIHDTWLSVLGITDDMLAISDEELENCYRYLRAVGLIIACKETAGRVSPKVWHKIEEKLMA